MMRAVFIWGIVVSLAVCATGRVLRVPQDYPTIQAGLDSTQAGDTVLVAVGVYAEALVAPMRPFVLQGDVVFDSTGEYPRPIIDPSSLPNPQNLSCLRLQGNRPIIEDMAFHNGPEMYRGRPQGRVGGISCSGGWPTLRRCVFDSVFCGIGNDGFRLILENCRFQNTRRFCVRTDAWVRATDCLFSCPQDDDWTYVMVRCADSSEFVRCHFRDNSWLTMTMEMYGRNLRISQCLFSPGGDFFWRPVEVGLHGRMWVDSCVFTGLDLTRVAMFAIGCDCDNPEAYFTFRGNQFYNNRNGYFLVTGCQPESTETRRGFVGEFENNVLRDLQDYGWSEVSKGIITSAHMTLTRNRFERLQRPQAAVIFSWDSGSVLRDNLFTQTGFALDSREPTDAKWNWWGDRSGPHHSEYNPFGRGDSVTGPVILSPWYVDTSFLAVPEPKLPLPERYELVAYPNPFNGTARLKFVSPDIGIFRFELYDLLGRRVREIWAGPVPNEKEVLLDGSGLSSGVYFVRAMDTIYRRPVAMAKVVLVR